MKETCCGQKTSTRFCAHCGKELKPASDLSALVARCRKLAEGARNRKAQYVKYAEECTRKYPEDLTTLRQHQKSANSCEKNAAQWDGWADKLDALLAKETAQ